jgi:ribosomal protein S18 acetylase RimI-like enzyme
MDGDPGGAYDIREAREADVPALAALHVRTFNETHRGGLPGGPPCELRERQWREAFERQDGSWFCYVIEDRDGELVGFAKGTPHDCGVPGYAGELNKIYLLRRVQHKGLGRRLLCVVARRFLERGVTSMLLFGDAGNPSNGFYEAMGAERLYTARGEFHGGYGWPDLRNLIPRCDE